MIGMLMQRRPWKFLEFDEISDLFDGDHHEQYIFPLKFIFFGGLIFQNSSQTHCILINIMVFVVTKNVSMFPTGMAMAMSYNWLLHLDYKG